MSIQDEAEDTPIPSGPELTALGKRIEMLRIDRGISKQHLAHFAGTSRQQLWRVMTGKSDLTGSLRERLAEVLRVDGIGLSSSAASDAPPASDHLVDPGSPELTFHEYLASAGAIAATLRTLPQGDHGRRLKRALLDALEDAALANGLSLASHVFELRGRVVNGEV